MASSVTSSTSSKKKKKPEKEVLDESLAVPTLQLGDEIPEFTCDSTAGLFSFHDVIDGTFSVLVTFLHGFDPVATTELAMLAKLRQEFEARECTVVALCCDTKENSRRWIEDTHAVQNPCSIWFPIIADQNAEISRLLNLVKPNVNTTAFVHTHKPAHSFP